MPASKLLRRAAKLRYKLRLLMATSDQTKLAAEFESLIGRGYVRRPRGSEQTVAALIAEPENAGQIAEIVRKAEADGLTLAAVGSARTLEQIRRAPVDLAISLARMNRVVAYEPDDMTVIAEAGLTVGSLNRMTATRGQRLPVDPPEPDAATLGALIAAAKAGPIRLSEGTVRDLLIGVRFVDHEGRLVHGGGQVVKNVAGYDLMKVMTGSFGTLGIIFEATFKVRPIPPNYTVAIAPFDNLEGAFEAAIALNNSVPLTHLEVLSPALARNFADRDGFLVIAGAAGNMAEVKSVSGRMNEILGGGIGIAGANEAAQTYERLRDLEFEDASIAAQIAVMPLQLPQSLKSLGVEFRAHAGSGVAQIYLAGESSPTEAHQAVARWRAAAREGRGNLRVLKAAESIRPGLAFFDEPPAPALGLMRRMKTTFDPHGIFNPGCFVAGL